MESSGSGGIGVTDNSQFGLGYQLQDFSELPRVVRITSTGANPYSAVPQYFDAGSWSDYSADASPPLSDVYEISGSTSVPADTIVLVHRNPAGDGWLFSYTPVGITVKESDGTPSYAGITSLEFDQADGYSISQPGSKRAKVNFSGGGGGVLQSHILGFLGNISVDDTWVTIGGTFTVPTTDLYHVVTHCAAIIYLDPSTPPGSCGWIVGRYWNNTTSTQIQDDFFVGFCQEPSLFDVRGGGSNGILSLTAGDDIVMQFKRIVSGGTVYVNAGVIGGVPGEGGYTSFHRLSF